METFDTINTFKEEDAQLFDSLLDDVRVVLFVLNGKTYVLRMANCLVIYR